MRMWSTSDQLHFGAMHEDGLPELILRPAAKMSQVLRAIDDFHEMPCKFCWHSPAENGFHPSIWGRTQ